MIQRFRFSRVALLVALTTGCATVNDMRAQKASGLAQSYPVPPDRAWQIAHSVLDATSAVAIEEHQPDGYLVADTPAFLWGLPTRVAVWIDPEGSGSRVTVRCRLVRPGPFLRALSEEEFHQAFARRVTQLAHSATSPPEGDPLMPTRRPCVPLATLCCLLALATSASADGAWILWGAGALMSAGQTTGFTDWVPMTTYETQPGCALAAEQLRKEPDREGTLRPGVNYAYYYECLPDIVDPRGSKGK